MNDSDRLAHWCPSLPLRIFLHIVAVLVVSIVLFHLRWIPPKGADGYFMAKLIENEPFPLYYRSILTVLLHRLSFVCLSPWGFDGWNAIAYSSSLAGGLALWALVRISRHPVFLAINILSGSFLVFVGHVENYAWVNAFLLLALWAMREWLDGKLPLAWAMSFFIAACLSHMLTLFYIPAFAYLLWRDRRFHPLEVLIPMLVFLFIIVFGTLCFPMLGTDIGLERLMPLFKPWAPNQFIPFFSWEHVKILAYFHHSAAFLGIPLEIPIVIVLWKRIDTPYMKFLGLCVLCGIAWTSVWHPDWKDKDWDLFSQFGIPLHVLVGLLLCGWVDETFGWKNLSRDAQRG